MQWVGAGGSGRAASHIRGRTGAVKTSEAALEGLYAFAAVAYGVAPGSASRPCGGATTPPARRRRPLRSRGQVGSVIVQPRTDGLRLVRQHDHALAAGELAHAWRSASGALPFRLVAAVGLHDLAWRALDDRPSRDPESGRPHSFDAYPLVPKLRAYSAGIDEMEAVDPWVGLLGSLHYSSFVGEEAAADFLDSERRRRSRLEERLRERAAAAARDARSAEPGAEHRPAGGGGAGGARSPDPGPRARRHLRWLKFFDGLSLRLCLAPPEVPDAELPAWLDRGTPLSPPEGDEVALRWRDGGRLELGGAPLAGPVALEVPVRDLPERSYADAAALRAAWERAPVRTWRVRVTAGA